jgi:monofunctional biosynthetic peptidoglycan transglycosylase
MKAFPGILCNIEFQMIKRLLTWLWKIVAGFILASVLGVLIFKWMPVPFTWLMLIRKTEAVFSSEKDTELRYQWRAYEDISPNLAIAMIASEDQLFLEHFGFDLKAMEKAVEHNKKSKRMRGASTITQQVAKNLFLWPGRSYVRKAFEAWFTILIEIAWSKKRILEVYMNIAETGRLCFGAEAAAKKHFKTTAKKLSLDQAAAITAVLPNPLEMNAAKPSGYVNSRKQHIKRQVGLFGGTGYLKNMEK